MLELLTSLRLRLRALFNRQHDRELREELEFHIEQLVEQNRTAGLGQHEARAAAHRQLGNLTRLQEQSHDLFGFRSIEDLGQDLRYGVRMLAKSPGFTTVAVLSLALGIGATSTIFSVLNAAVLRPLPFEEPDRLVAIREFDPVSGLVRNPIVSNFLAWREQNQTFEQIALGMRGEYTVRILVGGGTERVQNQEVGAHLFRLLGVEAVLGRWFAAEDFPA